MSHFALMISFSTTCVNTIVGELALRCYNRWHHRYGEDYG